MIFDDLPTYDYFSPMVPSFKDKRILDFGCNKGNLLASSGGVIQQGQYTGIDLDRDAIHYAKSIHPDATWLCYNRRNSVYNPGGDSALPNTGKQFDLIISYSVFTHMDIEDTMDVLKVLYKQLAPRGSMYFTYCNVNRHYCLDYFIKKRIDRYGRCDSLSTSTYLYLVNECASMVLPSEPCEFFVSFYDENWLLDMLKEFNPTSIAPTIGWRQDCMRIDYNV